ncbi:hypothetical protein RRF57_000013 [Xylaria bambusicola]|uniref:Uncharacterized protein n=1 Tax=Xylaria bambusicola TaxID=326684 RepID=A0AAN7UBF6_9PEZI
MSEGANHIYHKFGYRITFPVREFAFEEVRMVVKLAVFAAHPDNERVTIESSDHLLVQAFG